MERLDIYLNDHLAGATLGVELSRRAAAATRGTELGEFSARLHEQICEDRDTLRKVMAALAVDASPLKPSGAWLLEKVGRLKLNGQIRGRSPLSDLVELEALEAGVSGKRALWQALESALADDPRLGAFGFEALVERADEQLRGLEAHRVACAPSALGTGTADRTTAS
jgi:hypothetical protein